MGGMRIRDQNARQHPRALNGFHNSFRFFIAALVALAGMFRWAGALKNVVSLEKFVGVATTARPTLTAADAGPWRLLVAHLSSSSSAQMDYIALNNIADNPGATHQVQQH